MTKTASCRKWLFWTSSFDHPFVIRYSSFVIPFMLFCDGIYDVLQRKVAVAHADGPRVLPAKDSMESGRQPGRG